MILNFFPLVAGRADAVVAAPFLAAAFAPRATQARASVTRSQPGEARPAMPRDIDRRLAELISLHRNLRGA